MEKISTSKYRAQMQYNKTHFKRLTVDFKPEILERFKAACYRSGTTPSAEIKKFVQQYAESH